ncbi:hypothetical protein [Ferrovum sp.]|uniref:hypothetical protein n=1 Tax=Ferrovum sp. TaxID=2609467 RepID=UPI00260DBEEB|nr:hypothetical protein [Ferrovum sp.]
MEKSYGVAFVHPREPTLYYTGRAGSLWLSENRKDAFCEYTKERAAYIGQQRAYYNNVTLGGYTPIVIEKEEV